MIKTFCDRCGKEFDLASLRDEIRVIDKDGAFKYYHLCKKCLRDTIEFINGLEDKS